MKRFIIPFRSAWLLSSWPCSRRFHRPRRQIHRKLLRRKQRRKLRRICRGPVFIRRLRLTNRPSAEKQQIQAKTDTLGGIIRELRSRRVDDGLLADVEIFYEAARWKMAYPEEFFRQRTVADTLNVLDKGLERAAQLKEGKSPWTTQKGRVVRGYRSALDDSVQPVRVTVPDEYDGTRAFPLDVAQHGRFTSLYEVETLNSWQGAEIEYLPGTVQIDLFGRGKNTYHWPGEADVFEAIAFARKAYRVDSERMTLRGFSMGGAGVWHTSLAFPRSLDGR